MTDRHKHPPIQFRPPAQDREWLLAYSAATGVPVNRILADALTVFRSQLAIHCSEHQQSECAGMVRAYECGTSEPAAPPGAAGEFSQVSGGGSGI